MTTITTNYNVLLKFNEAKNREALRVKKLLTHEEFLLFLIKLYKRVEGDTTVLNNVWEKVKGEMES